MMASSQLHGLNRGRHSPEWTPEMRDRQARGKDPSKEEELPEPPSKKKDPEALQIGGRQVFFFFPLRNPIAHLFVADWDFTL